MKLSPTLGCALVMGALATDAAAAQDRWTLYRNDRFGYSVRYPSSELRAEPESDNGDGRKLTALAGAGDVLVWGAYREKASLKSEIRLAEQDCVRPPSYSAARLAAQPPFAAMSCVIKGGAILYTKAMWCDGVLTEVQFNYPGNDSARWTAIVRGMSASLSAGCGLR